MPVISRTKDVNLAALADKLESLPKRYKAFDMGVFMDATHEERIREYAQHNGGVNECGAVACAVGHGPAAGFLFPKPSKRSALWDFDEWSEELSPNWHAYSARFFINESTHRAEWAWCFGGHWAEVDNHPWGAAARISWLLAGNKPPQVQGYDGELVEFRDSCATLAHRNLYKEFRKS